MQTICQADHTNQVTAYPWTLIHDNGSFRGWFAALVDACGTIQAATGLDPLTVRVDHQDPALVARVAEIAEVGAIGTHHDGTTFWRVTGDQAALVLGLVAPLLIIQKRAALQAQMVAIGVLQPGQGLDALLAI
jgi:hypothetical protein